MIYVLLIIVFIIVYIITVRKFLRRLESILQDSEQALKAYEGYIVELSNLIEKSNKHIEEVDSNGHFRTDDEVEVFFTTLKDIQQVLNNFALSTLIKKSENEELSE